MSVGSRPTIFDSADAESYLKLKISEVLNNINSPTLNRTFHLGQVISVKDETNTNRLQIRIPIVDDIFYLTDSGDVQGEEGDDKLPWCIPANNRFVSTPDINSIVLVALMEPRTPYVGRIWFTALSEEVSEALFSTNTLTKELDTDKNWENAEKVIATSFKSSPSLQGRKAYKKKSGETIYPTGIKGKDKNKLVFEEGKTILVQNEKEKTESKVELTKDALIQAQKLNLLSTNSKRKEEPVFAKPLFEFMAKQNALLNAIITLLAASPGVGNLSIPVGPSPQAPQLVSQYATLKAEFEKLKKLGKSNDITIN